MFKSRRGSSCGENRGYVVRSQVGTQTAGRTYEILTECCLEGDETVLQQPWVCGRVFLSILLR